MDLNDLFHREGVERLRATVAVCAPSRAAHLGLANLYRDRIDVRRRAANDDAGPELRASPPRF